jgi:hypothetical protein
MMLDLLRSRIYARPQDFDLLKTEPGHANLPPAGLRNPCGECVRPPIWPVGQIRESGGVTRISPHLIPPGAKAPGVPAKFVKELVLYAAQCGPFKFFAAWVAWSGTFLGWMRIQPAIEGVDSDYAVGGVLGRQLIMGISLDITGHMAVDKFQQVLKEVAWDLGAAEGLTD